jgi:hypothetical protein
MTGDLTPDRAREIDYALQRQRFGCIFGACWAWIAAAIFYFIGESVVVAVIIGVGGSALLLAYWLTFSKALRMELARFIDPSTGELSIPGGCRRVGAREALFTLFWSDREDRVLFGGILVGLLLLFGGFLLLR